MTEELRRRLANAIARSCIGADNLNYALHGLSIQDGKDILALLDASNNGPNLRSRLAELSARVRKEYLSINEDASPSQALNWVVYELDALLASEAGVLPQPSEFDRHAKRYSQAELEESLQVAVDRTIQNCREGRIDAGVLPARREANGDRKW